MSSSRRRRRPAALGHPREDRPHILDRVIKETQGNPLALLELTRGLTVTQMAGGMGLLNADKLPSRIEQSFLNRVQELPEDPAADARRRGRTSGRSRRAASCRRPAGHSLATALADGTDGLLTIGHRVTFRHPLVRSAVYGAAKPRDRRAVHRVLADVTDAPDAADRRAWHLASATAGPDETVAAELERSAGRAQAHGGMAAAAAFLQRTVELTADSQRRSTRQLAAAQASLQAGELDDVHRLLTAVGAEPLDGFHSGLAGVLRGQVAFVSGAGSAAIPMLLDAADHLVSPDPQLARETYLTAWGMAVSVADQDILLAVSRAVRKPPQEDVPAPLDLLLEGIALLVTDGRAAAAATLQQAATALIDLPTSDVLRWGWVATGASAATWDDKGGMRAIYARQVQIVRDAGAFGELPYHLSTLGYALSWAGDFEGAAAVIAEGDIVAAATGNPMPPYPALRLLSLRGRETETTGLIAATIRGSAATGFGMGITAANWAGAVLYNGLGRYPEAMRAARASGHISEPWISTWLLPELVEAATRAGERDPARNALRRLVEATAPFSTDFAAGVEARTRALVAEGAAADDLYRAAIECLARTQLRPELARAHLLYGEWLRRGRQRIAARDHLRAAHEMFLSIGMEAFAERARRELLATGERVRKRSPEASSSDELTPQERQIALLVREGLSNPEVGARLFLSPRTVEWHLRKIFAKLSITSRRQLRDLLHRDKNELIPK